MAVRPLADEHSRNDQLGRGPGQERQHADGDRPAARLADDVVPFDGGKERRGIVGVDPGRDAATGDTNTVAYEQQAVAPGDVVQIDLRGERPGDGADQRAVRVAVISCAAPPVNSSLVTPVNPAWRRRSSISAGGGR